jgi:hypothetical protein
LTGPSTAALSSKQTTNPQRITQLLFHLRRDHVTASEYRAARAGAFEMWADISGVAAAA